MRGSHASPFRHSQVVEDQSDVERELTHLLRNAVDSFGLEEADRKAPQSGDVLRAVSGAYAASVVIIVPVDDVMAAVLDAPVAAIGVENVLGVGLRGCSAGDAVGDVEGRFAGPFVEGVAFDEEDLADVGEVEVVVECAGGPDFSGLNASVLAVDSGEVGLLARLQDEVIMRLSVPSRKLIVGAFLSAAKSPMIWHDW